MIRSLTEPLRWFMFACVALAIWQSYNGDPAAIAQALWGAVQTGADFLTEVFTQVKNTE